MPGFIIQTHMSVCVGCLSVRAAGTLTFTLLYVTTGNGKIYDKLKLVSLLAG